MEQSPSQNQNPGFLRKNQGYWFLVGLIAIVAIIYFAARNETSDGTHEKEDNEVEQVSGENTTTNGTAPTSENLTATGTLRLSDDPAKGNLMVISGLHKIYIATSRDFSALLAKEVTMEGQGLLSSFVFLGFKEAAMSPPVADAPVQISGTLRTSDDVGKGNYQIISGSTKAYLQSVRDYSALLGQEVDLSAQGTLQSFTGAKISKK